MKNQILKFPKTIFNVWSIRAMMKIMLLILLFFNSSVNAGVLYKLTATNFENVNSSILRFEIKLQDLDGDYPIKLYGVQLIIKIDTAYFNNGIVSMSIDNELIPNTFIRRSEDELRIVGASNIGGYPITKTKICDITLSNDRDFIGNLSPKWKNSVTPFTFIAVYAPSDSILVASDSTNHIMDYTTNIVSNISQELNYYLQQNYPNPFNPSTKISYGLRVSSYSTLKIFDVLGNEVAVLVNETKPAGSYEVEFSAENVGRDLASGIYFYSLSVDGVLVDTKRMVLLK